MIIRPWICVALLATVGSWGSAQPVKDAPTPLVGARQLALSPDGQKLAFVYQGDIWVASSEGGMARPVTNHIEMDEAPAWSPNGEWLSFTTNRNGNNDIYLVPSEGGASRRLTWSTAFDAASSWTPDGKSLLMAARREDEWPRIVSIDATTGQMRERVRDYLALDGAIMSADSQGILFGRSGFPLQRARYEGSAARQLVWFETRTRQHRTLRSNGFQHLWNQIGSDGKIYCVTVSEKTPSAPRVDEKLTKFIDNASRTPNIYEIGMNGSARRLTNYVGGGVRYLTAARSAPRIAFEYEGDLYTMKPGETPRKISVFASLDDKVTYDQRLILTTGASQGALSPKNDQVAFTVRGELWLVPVKKGKGPNADDARQLTNWAGVDEDVFWHPEGKQLFFTSDRGGADQLYQLNAEDLSVKLVSTQPNDILSARITPDRKSISYWQTGTLGGLYLVPLDLNTGPQRVFEFPGEFNFAGSPQYDLSPDMQWLAYVRSTDREGTMLMVANLKTGSRQAINLFSGTYISPRWSGDGRYLYFLGDREGPGIYAVPLKAEDALPAELDLKFVKPTETPKVEIDFDGIDRRIRRLVSSPWSGTFRPDPTTGDLFLVQEGDLWRANYAGDELRRITSGGGISDWNFSDDFTSAFFVRGGVPNILALRNPQFPISPVTFRADWTRDLRREWRAAFTEFWRAFNRSFYDSNFHGRDWAAIKTRYEKLLPSIGHRNEFSELLETMVGELEASHTETSPAGGNPGSQSSAHLGFTYDYDWQGPGIRAAKFSTGSPGSFARTRIRPGEYVMAINGKDIRLDEALYRDVLNEQVGREVTLLVSATPSKSGAREVKYRALSGGAFRAIQYRNRIEARRAYVESKSNGALTYVHIQGMGQGNFDRFNREVWLASQGRKGVIIDVRDNGGGNISDRLIDILERRPHSFYRSRDDVAELAPAQSWNLPTVVMHSQTSFSNAEMFPYAMRQSGLAKRVGMPTPGYVIWTYGLGLVDGTGARMPTAGVFRLDGSPLENQGQQPDFKVDLTVEDFLAGRDPQLDKAIEVLKSMGK